MLEFRSPVSTFVLLPIARSFVQLHRSFMLLQPKLWTGTFHRCPFQLPPSPSSPFPHPFIQQCSTRNPNVWLHLLRLKHLIRNFRDWRDRSVYQSAKIDFTCTSPSLPFAPPRTLSLPPGSTCSSSFAVSIINEDAMSLHSLRVFFFLLANGVWFDHPSRWLSSDDALCYYQLSRKGSRVLTEVEMDEIWKETTTNKYFTRNAGLTNCDIFLFPKSRSKTSSEIWCVLSEISRANVFKIDRLIHAFPRSRIIF